MAPRQQERRALIQKWIRALRNKKYGQCRSALRSDKNRFCCLGVLCDIQNRDGWARRGAYDSNGFYWKDSGDTTVLPPSLQDEIGMEDASGDFILTPRLAKQIFEELPHLKKEPKKFLEEIREDEANVETALVSLNDMGFSFRMIAFIIEKRPPGLFKSNRK